MNGNFEYDKSTYPFSAMRIGNGTKVTYTPTLKTFGESLPPEVATSVALELNIKHHSKNKDIKLSLEHDIGSGYPALVRKMARQLLDQGDIGALAYQQALTAHPEAADVDLDNAPA